MVALASDAAPRRSFTLTILFHSREAGVILRIIFNCYVVFVTKQRVIAFFKYQMGCQKHGYEVTAIPLSPHPAQIFRRVSGGAASAWSLWTLIDRAGRPDYAAAR